MKNLLIVISLCLFYAVSSYGNNGVPVSVKQTFTELYPTIKTPFWEKRMEVMVAQFKDEDGYKKAFFAENGNWIETRHRMNLKELPKLVRYFVLEKDGAGEVTFAGKVSSNTGIWYRIESEFIDRIVLKNVDANGVLLSQEEIKFSFQNIIPSRFSNMAPKLLPVRLIFPLE